MNGPTEELRALVGGQLQALREEGSEDHLDGFLAEIESLVQGDIDHGFDDQDPIELLAAVDAWAGLASHVMSGFYAPASPWPRSVAGWGTKALKRLRSICVTLQSALQAAATALGAASWSISVGFPWGISVGVSWP